MMSKLLIILLFPVFLIGQDTVTYRKKVIVQESSRLILRNSYKALIYKDSVKIENKTYKNFKRTKNSLFVFTKKNKIIYYEKE